ncbi:MAG: DNA-primase RepB domain-containing protein [Terracidiphilus sp.]
MSPPIHSTLAAGLGRKRASHPFAIYIDIDCDGDARVAALRASDAVPPPTAILATSPGKYQALSRISGVCLSWCGRK